MKKLELLSNISTANLNTGNITEFFETIKAVKSTNNGNVQEYVVNSNNLREDKVVHASAEEKELIMANFPKRQGTYLVVPKVI